MALGNAAFGITLTLGLLTLIFSIMVLAYAGGINHKGTGEQKAFNAGLRKSLIVSSSILLAFSVVAIIVVSVWWKKDREIIVREL